uniref:Uncharacterized protein n=1 Tax=Trichogramma kaykai TaxID=54128 RepID=A0ABD2VWW5_9HYME
MFFYAVEMQSRLLLLLYDKNPSLCSSFILSYTHFFFVSVNLEAKTHYGVPIHFRQSALRICNLLLSDSMNGCRSPGTSFASYSMHGIRDSSIFIFTLIFINSTALTFQMNK